MSADNYLNKLEFYDTCIAVVNVGNIVKNYEQIKQKVGQDVVCSAVVKADAYGLGATKIAPALESNGCRNFFVATIAEGIEIRDVLSYEDSNIFVLGGVLKNTEHYFIDHKLTPVITNDKQLEIWNNYAKALNTKLKCILHVDTGMTRNGFTVDRLIQLPNSGLLSNVEILYIMSHFACADDVSNPMNDEQIQRFNEACAAFPGIKKSISSTNGIFLGQRYLCDMVRPGKALYGFAIRSDLIGTLNPVVSLYARIIQTNEIDVGQTVGYGATFVANKHMRLVTVGIGYADGLMRKLAGFGYAYINNIKIPMIGRISMDYSVFDVTDVPEQDIDVGKWITLADDTNTLEQLAIDSGTIPHEITCKLGPRVKKIYVGID